VKGKLRQSISPKYLRATEGMQQLNRRSIPLVNNVKYLGAISDERMASRLYIERTAVKPLVTYRSELFSTNIKCILYKALMVYAREYKAEAHLLKLQRLQNRVRRAIGYLDRRTPVRELHLAFKIHYLYDYITKLCRTNHPNPNVRTIGQGEVMHKKYIRLTLGGGQTYDHSGI
jgi:hypothetical protein